MPFYLVNSDVWTGLDTTVKEYCENSGCNTRLVNVLNLRPLLITKFSLKAWLHGFLDQPSTTPFTFVPE